MSPSIRHALPETRSLGRDLADIAAGVAGFTVGLMLPGAAWLLWCLA